MGKLINIIYGVILIILAISCTGKGYINQYGYYVPKKTKFRLKDKAFLFPQKLDTINIYKLVYKEYMGKPEFSEKDNIWSSNNSDLRKIYFIKFYPKGQCIKFSIRTKSEEEIIAEINKIVLNPELATKGYYFYDGKKIIIETFVYGEGYGRYLMFDYYLSDSGDTLTMIYQNSKSIYVKKLSE